MGNDSIQDLLFFYLVLNIVNTGGFVELVLTSALHAVSSLVINDAIYVRVALAAVKFKY
jgi:hypothetical protein